jgi:hydrogenase nickel incorporation protein HypA/HybF
MHELPITQGILDVVLATAAQAGVPRVLAVDLVIGTLSGIVDDSVQFYFDILSQGTVAEGAALRIRHEPGEALCLACGHRFHVSPPLVPLCPQCDSSRLQVQGGRAMRVESIEVDDESTGRTEDP